MLLRRLLPSYEAVYGIQPLPLLTCVRNNQGDNCRGDAMVLKQNLQKSQEPTKKYADLKRTKKENLLRGIGFTFACSRIGKLK
jgi:hypothetical protein